MRALIAGLIITLAIGVVGCSSEDDGGEEEAAPAAESTEE